MKSQSIATTFAIEILFTYCSFVQVCNFYLKMKSLQLRLQNYTILFFDLAIIIGELCEKQLITAIDAKEF